mmetsp:Transcript_14294/g.29306  ORF Transcript_14294/g.29306 Transcript_14294/m.29306 type:complete len:135 (-) Transcript_14294:657-1061(-)
MLFYAGPPIRQGLWDLLYLIRPADGGSIIQPPMHHHLHGHRVVNVNSAEPPHARNIRAFEYSSRDEGHPNYTRDDEEGREKQRPHHGHGSPEDCHRRQRQEHRRAEKQSLQRFYFQHLSQRPSEAATAAHAAAA